MADAAGFDAKANLAYRRINEWTLHEVHFSRRSHLNGAISGHAGGFLSGFSHWAGVETNSRHMPTTWGIIGICQHQVKGYNSPRSPGGR